MENEVEETERPPSVRRAFTLRHNAARQVAVNFMPSRQLSYNTLRLRRANSEHNALLEEMAEAPDAPDADMRANMIVREMEQHQRLMEDNPASEELRREALRDLPQGLTMKRHVRAKLSASVSLRSKRRPISCGKSLKYRASFALKRMRERVRDVVFSVELWYESIRKIEGHFGSAVGSYFYFLRYLFLLDLLLCAVLLSFVVVPQALRDVRNGTSSPGTFAILDLVSGEGSFADSLLFYGHYHPGDVGGVLPYDMPYAYFFTMLCVYVVFLALLCYRTAYSYRRNFIETSGGLSHVFASRVFCGWDFGIAVPSAARLNAAGLYRDFKELLSDQNKKQSTDTFWPRVRKLSTNMAVTGLAAAAAVGGGYGLWVWLAGGAPPPLVLSSLLAVLLAGVPLAGALVSRWEYYSPRTGLYMTLARTWALAAGALLLLLVFWARSGAQCWETAMGQEAYRLVVLDAAVSLVLLPAVEFSRAFIFKSRPSGNAPEFNIAYNSLTVIYNQALLWFGVMFSPLLAVAVTVKLLLLFYVKRECALRACQPATKVWRAEQTQTVFYLLVTMSLFAALAGFGMLFLGTESEGRCGPFGAYRRPRDVAAAALGLPGRPWLARALAALARPAVVGGLLLALGVGVYLMRARAQAQRGAVELLRRLLVLQAKDKDFLLGAIAKVAHGEWQYSPREGEGEGEGVGVDSHTWRYARDVRKPSNAEFHFDASRLGPAARPTPRPTSWDDGKDKQTDGDTDSSFSWQGSTNCLNQTADEAKWL